MPHILEEAVNAVSIASGAAAGNPAVESYTGQHIYFYDGLCVYCQGIVHSCIEHDEKSLFFYSPLQSEFAQRELARYGINSLELRSLYVISDFGTAHEALRAAAPGSHFILANLGGEMRLLAEENGRKSRSQLDAEYNAASEARYHNFGKLERIEVPGAEVRSRFIF